MMHTLLKYYQEELEGWGRVLEFHKEESGDLVRKLTYLIGQRSPYMKISNSFIDQLIVQSQQLEHIKGLIRTQLHRVDLESAALAVPLDQGFVENQDALRTKMHASERNFARTKYGSSFFLFTTLNEVLLRTGKEKVIAGGTGEKEST